MPPPDAAAVRAQLERILGSSLFANAGRVSRLLRFTVERTLEGEGDRLKEYLLGVEVFDRDEQYDPRLDSIVRVEARRLRARLTEYYSTAGTDDTVLIRFEKGGYAPQFEWRSPPDAEAVPATAAAAVEPSEPSAPPRMDAARRRARWPWATAGGILVLLVLVWVFPTRPAGEGSDMPARATIAVLPLAHFGEDATDDALADRLTDGVITELGRVPSLHVISRTSVMQYKGTRRPLREVAAALTANVILEGSVLRDDGRVQVKARLVDAATDTKFWADIFQSEPDRLFDLQRRIAQAVTAAIERRERGER